MTLVHSDWFDTLRVAEGLEGITWLNESKPPTLVDITFEEIR